MSNLIGNKPSQVPTNSDLGTLAFLDKEGLDYGLFNTTNTYSVVQNFTSIKLGDNLVLPNTSGNGIKLNNTTPAFGWKDLTSSITVRGSGVNAPSWAAWLGNMYAYSFSASTMQECWLEFHLDHDYAPDTAIHFHTHWLTTGTNTGTCRWGFEYTHAKGHNQANFPATTTIYAEQAYQGTAYRHMITETTAVTITGLEPDSLILVRIFRDAAHVNDTLTDVAFLLTSDIHYQSTGIATKNKTPNFYT